MASKYDLHHWDNSHLKNLIIIALCFFRNDIYLVYDDKTPIATFQTKKMGKSFMFQKLATLPEYAGRGVGTFCLNEIERLGKTENCIETICEVYDKSEHAKQFYEHKGYVVYGTTDTLKYQELKLKKEI
jgi:GNAT superfamily N-acetyltransferase